MPLSSLSGFTGSPTAVAFLPDGSSLLSVSDDGTAYQWNTANSALKANFGVHSSNTNGIYKIAVSPGGHTFTIGGPDSISTYSLDDGHRLFMNTVTAPITSLVYSSDGSILIAASRNTNISAFQSSTGKLLTTHTYPDASVYGLVISRKQLLALSGADDATVRLWQLKTLPSLSTVQKKIFPGLIGTVNAVAFSPDEKSVLGGSFAGTIGLWDTQSAKMMPPKFQGHTASINMVGFFPNGQAILTASDDMTARVWNVADGREICQLKVGAKVTDAAIALDGKFIVTASGAPINPIATSPATASPLSAGTTGRLDIWSACI